MFHLTYDFAVGQFHGFLRLFGYVRQLIVGPKLNGPDSESVFARSSPRYLHDLASKVTFKHAYSTPFCTQVVARASQVHMQYRQGGCGVQIVCHHTFRCSIEHCGNEWRSGCLEKGVSLW